MAQSTGRLNIQGVVAPRTSCFRNLYKWTSNPLSIHQRNATRTRKLVAGPIEAASLDRLPDDLTFEDGEMRDVKPDAKTLEFAQFLAQVADQIKCEGISLLLVGTIVDWTDYFLIVSAFSKPQMEAVLVKLEEAGGTWSRHPRATNPGRSEWEVMDYGDLIVHIMSPRKREYYDLEGLYRKAEEIPLNLGPAPGSPQWVNSLKE